MIRGRVLIVVCAGLAMAGSLYADMMPLAGSEGGCPPVARAGAADERAAVADAASCSRVAELSTLWFNFLPEVRQHAEPAAETHTCKILTDSADSFSLCLYALIGLGVFRSGHYVRRCSLSFIPEWYHSGAPQQIGHSHAVGPDAFCHAAVCFVQADAAPDRLMPHYRAGTIVSLVRHSQFTRTVLASRAPPSMS